MEGSIRGDFLCVICQNVLTSPVTHTPCRTDFCNDCIQGYISENSHTTVYCPICRGNLPPKLLKTNSALNRDISRTKHVCSCGQEMNYNYYNAHMNSCPAMRQAIATGIQNAPKPVQPVVNRSTFKCPACSMNHLSRDKLIKHFQQKHSKRSGVCPICAVMPWGDPNYVSSDLLGHMKMRHKYDVDTYTDFSMEDDAILQRVIEESKNNR